MYNAKHVDSKQGQAFNELCDTMGKSTRTRPDAAKASAQQPARTPVQYPARESPVPAEDELQGPKFANSLANSFVLSS